jgi:hypothetical protein
VLDLVDAVVDELFSSHEGRHVAADTHSASVRLLDDHRAGRGDEVSALVAHNVVHHSREEPSSITLTVRAADAHENQKPGD